MQIIYISNRPEILNATLRQVALFMPFIENALILCPSAQHAEIQEPRGIKLTLLADELFVDLHPDPQISDHHVFRNYYLRSKLIQHNKVQEEFILSDDDYRPIRPLSIEVFKKEGKYRSYYFYNLADWTSNATEFDKGQQATHLLLSYFNLPTLGFASHMPQMMTKTLYQKAVDFFAPHAKQYPLCEWATYYNYNQYNAPELFHAPEIFQTLGWPELPLIWPYFVKPRVYSFENYYPTLYEAGNIFHGLSECPELNDFDSVNLAKLFRLQEIEIGRIELPYHPNDPLGKGFLRHFVSKLTWVIGLLYKRVSLKERNDILTLKRKFTDASENEQKKNS